MLLNSINLRACFTNVLLAVGASLILSFGLAMTPLAAQEKAPTAPTPSAQDIEFFERKVRPVLADNCYSCHSSSSKKIKAGLVVDSRQGLLEGGDSGEALIPGEPDDSLLISAIRYEDYEMPPKGKLSDEQIADLEKWVALGAPWPSDPRADSTSDGSGGPGKPEAFDLQKRRDEFWLWQPPKSNQPPAVATADWPRDEIDQFVLAKLEANNLKPAADADALAIARRLHMDLTGLPATLEQLNQFKSQLKDDPSGASDAAIESLVDRLLASPHFGERWGRHWMDLVRYCESRGHEFDPDIPNAFQYRDYIIRALNKDIAYDQLVREHLAGDLLASPRVDADSGANESILGTGFWYMGEWAHSPVDIRKDESDRIDNMVDVMSKTFLGVTVSCARCHDHKFDAISTADYYSLTGFLQSSSYRQVRFESLEHNKPLAAQLADVDEKYQRQIAELLASNEIKPPSTLNPIVHEAIIFDYSRLPESEFLQDGFIFGTGSRRAGQAYLETDPACDAPLVRVPVLNAATNDPFWNGLQSVTLGKTHNRNQLANIDRSGRTLCTPTFELTSETVNCYVEGEGHIIACVDSHRQVFGPLHGETIVRVDAGKKWVPLKLGRYVGHRLHLEFVPATDKQLSVALVAQGLTSDQQKEIQQKLDQQRETWQDYAADAERILNRQSVNRELFADFESGSYGDWEIAGDAFGKAPQTLTPAGERRAKVNATGKFFVNSHANIGGGNKAREKGNVPTGTLTSPEFEIQCDSIEMLVGGGRHEDKTCVNLIVDGEVKFSATGRNENKMHPVFWDVGQLKGKSARIQAVDDHSEEWGNVGLDHIVFVSRQAAAQDAVSAEATELIDRWQAERAAIREKVKFKSSVALAMMDIVGEDAAVYIRGNSSKPGKVEARHFLTAVSGDKPMEIAGGSGRLELANHINEPTNPLTSRVIVNRIWHYLMGRGIVPTTDDFGVLGQRPTHPELLDYLALEFQKDGQSIKRMIRRIVLSRTYQMSTFAEAAALQADPKNLLWHHRPPKRLEAEIIRDQLLAVSGNLDRTLGGASVPIHLTSFMTGRGRPAKSGPLDGDRRRSVYISIRRNFMPPFMLAFDTPVPFSTMGKRNVSNVPSQALILMNDPLVAEQARDWAKRLQPEDLPQQKITAMYETAFGRQPTDEELETAMGFVGQAKDLETWTSFAHALINTKEFIFLR